MKKPSIIFLMGPTAAGKTDLAIELVQKIPSEIISVDSAMIYRSMDIGTGKPNQDELKKAPHHLINIKDPTETYSAASFSQDAVNLIHDIHLRGKIPILVGGTMLYFHALEYGLSPLPSSDPTIREKITQEANHFGWDKLYERLTLIDPITAKKINKNDPQRISRALEVFEITGQPLSSYFADPNQNFLKNKNIKNIQSNLKDFIIYKFALIPKDRKILHDRIEKRFHKMLELGFINEVERLIQSIFNKNWIQDNILIQNNNLDSVHNLNLINNLDFNLPSMRTVGYRQILSYLKNEISYQTMIQKALSATRQLAKRQLTWLRNSSNITNLEIENNHLDSFKTMIHCLS